MQRARTHSVVAVKPHTSIGIGLARLFSALCDAPCSPRCQDSNYPLFVHVCLPVAKTDAPAVTAILT